jgi:hypothetical protein
MKNQAIATIVIAGLFGYPQTAEAQADRVEQLLDVSITHIRDFIPEGRIQFVPYELSPEATRALDAWTHSRSEGFGLRTAVMECRQDGACRAIGNFRGIVEVEILESTERTAVLSLAMYRVGPDYQIGAKLRHDDVYLRREGSAWRIDRIVKVGES